MAKLFYSIQLAGFAGTGVGVIVFDQDGLVVGADEEKARGTVEGVEERVGTIEVAVPDTDTQCRQVGQRVGAPGHRDDVPRRDPLEQGGERSEGEPSRRAGHHEHYGTVARVSHVPTGHAG